MKPVSSLGDLRAQAETDVRYQALAILAAANLGKAVDAWEDAMEWLKLNAQEVDEDSLIEEVNGVLDMMEGK